MRCKACSPFRRIFLEPKHAASHLEAVIYQHKEDAALKTTIRFNKSVEEFLSHEAVNETWERIVKVIGSEPALTSGDLDMDHTDDESCIVVGLLGSEAPEMAEAVSKLNEEDRSSLAEYETEALRVVQGGTRFMDGTLTGDALAAAIKASSIGMVRGEADGYVLIVYDIKVHVCFECLVFDRYSDVQMFPFF